MRLPSGVSDEAVYKELTLFWLNPTQTTLLYLHPGDSAYSFGPAHQTPEAGSRGGGGGGNTKKICGFFSPPYQASPLFPFCFFPAGV